jgi:hypothetical protein
MIVSKVLRVVGRGITGTGLLAMVTEGGLALTIWIKTIGTAGDADRADVAATEDS